MRDVGVHARGCRRDGDVEALDPEVGVAERIRVVVDNLNIHTPATFYEAFEPAVARRLAQRLEFHYTPKHGSWLNMAELELSVFDRQCWDRRIGDRDNAIKRFFTRLLTDLSFLFDNLLSNGVNQIPGILKRDNIVHPS